jgi:hypothetical protein
LKGQRFWKEKKGQAQRFFSGIGFAFLVLDPFVQPHGD